MSMGAPYPVVQTSAAWKSEKSGLIRDRLGCGSIFRHKSKGRDFGAKTVNEIRDIWTCKDVHDCQREKHRGTEIWGCHLYTALLKLPWDVERSKRPFLIRAR